jgi:hypothetical protein
VREVPVSTPSGETLYVAECEYACGWGFGPAGKSKVWQRAMAHDKECFYGGPVIRRTTDPVPAWSIDPLMQWDGGPEEPR